MSINNNFNFDLDPVPTSTKESLFNPAASALGKAGGGIASFVSIPLRKVGLWSENHIKNYENNLLQKNQAIPEENRDFSKFQQTAKALDDAKYSLGEEDLQEYFTNLISATLDNRKNSDIHPSFSTILKDFSPLDAEIFNKIFWEKFVPVVTIVLQDKTAASSIEPLKNVLLFEKETSYYPEVIKFLERSGLIEVSDVRSLQAKRFKERYENFKKSSYYTDYLKNAENNPIVRDGIKLDHVNLLKGHITLTDIGKSFGNVVLADMTTYYIE